ncbi:MAG: metallophosphoesterase [Prevotellaceae bacterium]|nr:metallophosphoesterase [Prevotellaceae bacterium]
MRILFIIALSLVALGVDYYIYRQISRRWLRLCYINYAIVVDVVIFVFIFLAFRWPFYGPLSISPLPLWLAWFFFLNTIPKTMYILSNLISKRLALVVATLVTFLLIKGAFYDSRHFEVVNISVANEKIPPSFTGYKIALFSDLHLGNLTGQEKFLKKTVEQINRLDPNMILFAGDLVNMYASEISPDVQTILSKLNAPDGVYSVLGNHDMGAYFGNHAHKIGLTPLENTSILLQKQKEMGWKTLQNESILIGSGSDSIGLCGVPYPPLPPLFSASLTNFDLHHTSSVLNSNRYNILLCHTPKVWETMSDTPLFKDIDLTLSGHTHAMQTKIKIGSWQWSPAKWMYRNWSGLYEKNGRCLYVNEGTGYVLYPMRIGCKPEITLITLNSKEP